MQQEPTLLRRLHFSLRSLSVIFVALTLVTMIAANYWRQSERQRQSVEKLVQMGGKVGDGWDNNMIDFWYNDYLKWSDDRATYVMVIPPEDMPSSSSKTGVVEPKGIKGWVKRSFGIDYLYRPVVLIYQWEPGTELKLSDEMIELIRSLPIREIRLYKFPVRSDSNATVLRSQAEIHDELTAIFPDVVVTSHSD